MPSDFHTLSLLIIFLFFSTGLCCTYLLLLWPWVNFFPLLVHLPDYKAIDNRYSQTKPNVMNLEAQRFIHNLFCQILKISWNLNLIFRINVTNKKWKCNDIITRTSKYLVLDIVPENPVRVLLKARWLPIQGDLEKEGKLPSFSTEAERVAMPKVFFF